MKKKLFSGITMSLLCLLFFSSCGSASGGFADVDAGSWYEEGVSYVCDNGIMKGVGKDRFSPDDVMTRGMVVTVFYRMEGEPVISEPTQFSDVIPGAFYEPAVIWASKNGIVTGYNQSEFGPEDTITREQFAAILYRYAQSKGYNTSEKASLSAYEDASAISAYAVDAMQWSIGNGLINGTSPNLLTPSGLTTRAQAATIIMRYDGIVKTAPPAEETKEDDSKPVSGEDATSGEAKPDEATASDKKQSSTDMPASQGQTKPNPGQKDSGQDETARTDDTDPGPHFVVEQVTARPGDADVVVSVSVKNNPGILGMVLSVLYDDSVLTLKNADCGEALDGILSMTKPGRFESQCRFSWDGQEISDENVKDGTVLTLLFSVAGSASEGVYPVSLFYNQGDIVDNNLNPLTLTVKNGGVTVTP